MRHGRGGGSGAVRRSQGGRGGRARRCDGAGRGRERSRRPRIGPSGKGKMRRCGRLARVAPPASAGQAPARGTGPGETSAQPSAGQPVSARSLPRESAGEPGRTTRASVPGAPPAPGPTRAPSSPSAPSPRAGASWDMPRRKRGSNPKLRSERAPIRSRARRRRQPRFREGIPQGVGGEDAAVIPVERDGATRPYPPLAAPHPLARRAALAREAGRRRRTPVLAVGRRQRSNRYSPFQISSPARAPVRSWPVRMEANSWSGRSTTPMHLRPTRLAISTR